MSTPGKLNRRSVLKGAAGATLALPILEAMGAEVADQTPRRFCALYNALPTLRCAKILAVLLLSCLGCLLWLSVPFAGNW